MKVICLYVYNEPIDIDVYDANFSRTGLLLAEACEWISKLIIVMLTLCKTQRIVSLYCVLTVTLREKINGMRGNEMGDFEEVGAN